MADKQIHWEWAQKREEKGTYVCGTYGNIKFKGNCKIAGFDLDDTLITTKSGKRFPENKDDWKFKDNVEKILKQLIKQKYYLLIITNQKGLKTRDEVNAFMDKIESIAILLGCHFTIYVILGSDLHRKPFPTIWEQFIGDKTVNIDESFYCGDACGRKDDFSDTDLKFALNCKIKFKTPEHVFTGISEPVPPVNYPIKFDQLVESQYSFKPCEKEMIIIVGPPGSGKSTFVQKFLIPHHYVSINRDTLKTMSKCLKECKINIEDEKSIVIDNTNPSKKTRDQFIQLAKDNDYPCRCFHITTDIDLSKHNTYYRHYISHGEIPLIPEVVFRKYKKDFEKPDISEEFSSVVEVKFLLDKKINMEKYKMYFF